MKKLILLGISLLILQSATAQTAELFHRSLYEPDLILRFKSDIDLGVEQEREIWTIYQEQNSVFGGKRTEWAAKMEEFHHVVNGRQVDYNKADALFTELLALENEIKKLRLTTLIQIKNVLAAEQQEKLDAIKETNPNYEKAFELNLGTSPDGTRVIIQNVRERKLTEQEKALYYLIGNGIKEPVRYKDLNNIDPGDIESISVFKGETAIRKYGESGKDGIVEITIKKSAVQKYIPGN